MSTLRLTQLIAAIDHKINTQINIIIHQSEFQALEAGWRNLSILASQCSETKNVKLRVLNISFKELQHDLNKVIEFDQSELFDKIYHQEFSMPGGEPYGLLVGDFAVHLASKDILTLQQLADIAASSFVPIIMSVAPSCFELNDFSELEQINNFQSIFQQSHYHAWKAFRQSTTSRFISLVLPRLLLRLPYDTFSFKEKITSTENYLWGNPAFAFASSVIRTFAQYSWFTPLSHQIATSTLASFGTDKKNIALKHCTETYLTETQEIQLSDEGFLPLCTDHFTKNPLFFNCHSIYQSTKNDHLYITTLLSYLLCACRFAHYIKILGRDKIGFYHTPEAWADFLNQWLLQYIAGNAELSAAQRLKYPLRKAEVKVKQRPGLPGYFICTIQLEPHAPLSHLRAIFVLTTDIHPSKFNLERT